MRKKWTKFIAWVTVIALLSGIAIGCNNPSDNDSKDSNQTSSSGQSGQETQELDFAKLSTLLPGDESKRMGEFKDSELKDKLKNELNMELEIEYSPWGQYWQTLDLMLSAGEQLDFFWDGFSNVSNHYSKNRIMPLDELLNSFGDNIKRIIPEPNFEAARFDGKIYSIPSSYAPSAAIFYTFALRKDLLSDTGIDNVTSIADIENFFTKLKNDLPEINACASVYLNKPLIREIADGKNISFVDDRFFYIDEDESEAKVYSFFESDYFKEMAEITEKWVDNGWIPEEVITDMNGHIGRFTSGTYAANVGVVTSPLEWMDGLKLNVPDAEIKEFILAPDSEKYIYSPGNQAIMIPYYSENSERTIMFLNWMYDSQDNYNFLIYGIEGTDYEIKNGRIERLVSDEFFSEWMFRNIEYMSFPENVDQEFVDEFTKWDDDAKISKLFGFSFNRENVNEIIAKIQEAQTRMLTIMYGFENYDSEYETALEELKAAGLEELRAEYEKQLKEYLAEK